MSNVVSFFHMLLVLTLLIVPVIDGFVMDCEKWLTLCFVVVGLIMFHWITNNDKCALTILQSMIENKEEKDTFLGKIISPIYNVNKTKQGQIIWMCTNLLFLIIALMLHKKYDFSYLKSLY